MTETDLVTAGDSTENHKLSNSVTTNTSVDPDASGSAADTNSSASDGSLATMVLPELRALANRAGVKGTSGMRKNELIAAIRESRQTHANGAPSIGGAGGESDNHSAKAAANHAEATVDDATHADSSERGSSADRAAEHDSRAEKPEQTESDKPFRRAQPRNNQQDTKSEERESDNESDRGGDQQGSGAAEPRRRRRR